MLLKERGVKEELQIRLTDNKYITSCADVLIWIILTSLL